MFHLSAFNACILPCASRRQALSMFSLTSQSILIEGGDHGEKGCVYYEMRMSGPVQESFCPTHGRQGKN